MPTTKTVTVNTTELTKEDIEAALSARYERKGWTVEFVWDTGKARQPSLKIVRSKTTRS